MSSLLLFNRVYRLERQSVMLVFSTPFVNQRPSNLPFSLVHLSCPPSPPFLCEQLHEYVFIQCVTGGGGGFGALRQINTCRQVHFLVNFYETPTFRVWYLYRYLVHAIIALSTVAGIQLSLPGSCDICTVRFRSSCDQGPKANKNPSFLRRTINGGCDSSSGVWRSFIPEEYIFYRELYLASGEFIV